LSDAWIATSALATVALLIVTAAYVWITWKMLQAAREQSWQTMRPRLLVAARTNQGGQFLVVHIENVGASPAQNLRLSIDRPVHRMIGDNQDLRELPFFKNGLRSLPPSTPTRFGLGGAIQYFGAKADRSIHPLSFTLTATYTFEGRAIVEQFPIDIEDQYLSSTIERENIDEFGKNFPAKFERGIRDIVEAIESLNNRRIAEDTAD
jgi:hypothetical protein